MTQRHAARVLLERDPFFSMLALGLGSGMYMHGVLWCGFGVWLGGGLGSVHSSTICGSQCKGSELDV
jgi:hypothetical protein